MQKVLKWKWLGLFFLNYRIFVKKNPIIENCPKCNSYATLERLMEPSRIYRIPRFIGLKKFYCRKCKWEGHIYLYRVTQNLSKILLNYLFAVFALFVLYLVLLDNFDTLSSFIINAFFK